MQLQRIFYHPLRVGDPSLFPYHLQHLAWTFQVVYQTDAFSCKLCCCWGFLVLFYYISTSFEFGRKGQVPHGAASRSLKLDCQVQVDCLLMWHTRHFHNGHSLSPSPHDRSGLRCPPGCSHHTWRGAALQGDVVNMLYSLSLSRHEPRISQR